jgi:aspartyl-tRNA(Asn)/glutamyl-tRNA(Gln) amidotransferase subunit B
MPSYLPSIGMEVHAELATRSKMFCRCPVAFGGEPNTRVCPVCMALPGALPVPNRAAIEMVLRTALAVNCTIAMESIFHRKNYFYPDLPKGYQISQYGETNPLGYRGQLEIPLENGETKTIRIRRVHLEEDTGKLMHLPSGGSGVDYNRAGVPLMEIVTDFPPDIVNPEEAKAYLQELRHVLLYLGVCDGKMEQGSLRCEPNISIRPESSSEYGIKTELKNLNSFRSVQHGIAFEVSRQTEALERGEALRQETRGWNEDTESSFLMRTKETEQDYRYFPDPDLMPMKFDEASIAALRTSIPELPLAKSRRFQKEFGIPAKEAARLVADRSWAEFFEEAVSLGGDPVPVANWMNADFAMRLNEEGIEARASRVTPAHLVDLVRLIRSCQISGKIGKEVFAQSYQDGRFPTDILKESGRTQITDDEAIRPFAERTVSDNPEVVVKYKAGQTNVLGFLVGKTIKATQGRANPERVRELLVELLERA